MARQRLVERLVDLERLVLAALARQPACRRPPPRAAPWRRACRRARSACRLPCLLPATSRIRPACRSLKIAYHSGPVACRCARSRPWPRSAPCCAQAASSVAVRSVIGPRTDCARLLPREPRYCFCLSARTPRTSRAMRSVLVELQHALGESCTASSMSPSSSTREERALEQLAVLRIGAQRRAVIGGGGSRVALAPACGRRDSCRTRRRAPIHPPNST